jgi:hypothetical protein
MRSMKVRLLFVFVGAMFVSLAACSQRVPPIPKHPTTPAQGSGSGSAEEPAPAPSGDGAGSAAETK